MGQSFATDRHTDKAERFSRFHFKLFFQIRDNEYVKRTMISDMGVKTNERISLKTDKKNTTEEEEYECQTCSANLYVSFVSQNLLFGQRRKHLV
jgi:hypothetical protein